MPLIANKDKCPQDHKCPLIKMCPKGAITQKDEKSLPIFNLDLCIKCGLCVRSCPKHAVEKVV